MMSFKLMPEKCAATKHVVVKYVSANNPMQQGRFTCYN